MGFLALGEEGDHFKLGEVAIKEMGLFPLALDTVHYKESQAIGRRSRVLARQAHLMYIHDALLQMTTTFE
jgi:hypothetical protein